MTKDYACKVEIELTGGNVRIEISGDHQTFEYISGVGFVALPRFFYVLEDLYLKKIDTARLDNIGYYDYYNFTCVDESIHIEHFSHEPEIHTYHYQFNLQKFISAVCEGFSEVLQQHQKEGTLSLQMEEMSSPLSKEVLTYFNKLLYLLKEGHEKKKEL